MFKCIGNSIVHFQPYFKVMSFNKPNMHISPRNNLCMKIGSRFLYRVFQVSSEVFLIQMMFLYFNNNKIHVLLSPKSKDIKMDRMNPYRLGLFK